MLLLLNCIQSSPRSLKSTSLSNPLALNQVCQDQTNYYRIYATDVLYVISEGRLNIYCIICIVAVNI